MERARPHASYPLLAPADVGQTVAALTTVEVADLEPTTGVWTGRDPVDGVSADGALADLDPTPVDWTGGDLADGPADGGSADGGLADGSLAVVERTVAERTVADLAPLSALRGQPSAAFT